VLIENLPCYSPKVNMALMGDSLSCQILDSSGLASCPAKTRLRQESLYSGSRYSCELRYLYTPQILLASKAEDLRLLIDPVLTSSCFDKADFRLFICPQDSQLCRPLASKGIGNSNVRTTLLGGCVVRNIPSRKRMNLAPLQVCRYRLACGGIEILNLPSTVRVAVSSVTAVLLCHSSCEWCEEGSTPARTRTWNPRLRRSMLYPFELQAHMQFLYSVLRLVPCLCRVLFR
jgi:hypothetical protein